MKDANLEVFKTECALSYGLDEIDRRLLFKIAEAIFEQDEDIEMHIEVFKYSDRHSIECSGTFVDDFEKKIKKAVESAYVYHKNVEFGYGNTCSVKIPTSTFSPSVKKAIDEKRERNLHKKIAERVKPTCQFTDLVDYIVKLAEKGKYNKCDGIIEDFIRNYDVSQLQTEEEVLNDLQKVIDGTIDDEENDIIRYTDEVHHIADKYGAKPTNIESLLYVKIRCFDRDYLYRTGFFDLNTQDHEIVKRKLKGEPFDDVPPFKMLSEIDLDAL